MEEQVEQVEELKTNKSSWGCTATLGLKAQSVPQVEAPSTSSKYAGGGVPWVQVPGSYAGLGAAMAAELMIGFWFGIGAILAIKMVNSLEELTSRK